MAAKKNKKGKGSGGSDVAFNRQARFRYELLDRWEAGIELIGSEVKSLRQGGGDLKDSYATVEAGEVWLIKARIAPYAPANQANHEPERRRKLLLHRYEIDRLIGKTRESGLALVPTRIYFKGPRAKVEIALGKGKELRDKRRTMKDRESKRDIERALKERSR